MTRSRRTAALASALTASILLPAMAHAVGAANAPAAGAADTTRAAPRARVLAVDGYWLSVSNLDHSLAFYRDVLGLSLQSGGATPRDALLQSLTATPRARVRSATLRAATGPSLRLLEFSAVPRRVLHPHNVDPGAATLWVSVADIAVVLAAAVRAHTPIVTLGGAPMPLPDGTRSVVLRDPDGFFVALSQPARPATDASPVQPAPLSLDMRYTVAAPATMVRFYRQILGITLRAGEFAGAGPWGQLLDAPTAQWAVTQMSRAGAVPDEDLSDVQFVAFRHVARHTYSGRPQDPGTPALSLRVSNLSDALRAIHSAGLRVISAGGQSVPLTGGGAAVLFRDPAGVLVELMQR